VGVYDQLAYPGYAYAATHPARLEVIGRLFGLRPRPAVTSRVLEIGCGDGGNSLSLAQTLPGANILGIDIAPGAIERGARLAEAAGLDNVELRCLDLQALPEDFGSFDYIVAHGVYSWISPRARASLLAAIHRHLASEGIAFVSYNAYPGSYLRDMARDILGYHVRTIEDPQEKLAQAQNLMATIVAIEQPSPYAQVLREHMQRMLNYPDALLFHDDLAEISTPFYFHEFMEHAAHHQLAFLAEADLFESQMTEVPESAERLMQGLPEDVLVREQYLDFFKNRMFRQTLLCHRTVSFDRELDENQIQSFAVSFRADPQQTPPDEPRSTADEPAAETFLTPEGFSMTTSEPIVRAVMHALASAWPAALDFPALLAHASQAVGPEVAQDLIAARLCSVLLQAYLARIVLLNGCPAPLVNRPTTRPQASALARAQCESGARALSSLLHATVLLQDELEPKLLCLLDGTRDTQELSRVCAVPASAIDQALQRLASIGLLEG